MVAFTSAMAIIGRYRQNKRKSVPNNPNAPIIVPRSTHVGVKKSQLVGRKSFARLVTIITKRSNHMPMFTTRHSANIIGMLVRMLLNQNNCGVITLQLTMIQ